MSMQEDIVHRPVTELAPLIRQKQVSPRELTRAMLERIGRLQPILNAYITVTAEQAERAALEAEREIVAGRYRGPLHGIPVSIKDIFATQGVRTTAGSKILADWVPDHDATAVARLKAAGAVILGKTNTHEFAYGVTTDNPHYGATRNPWDLSRVPGGSSGGSGTAVAASLCSASLGSDTGGSIRIPSAACGVVGIKPTYGRVSRHGAIPLAWSLDHVGPLAKSVADAALVLTAIAGYDPLDATSGRDEVPDYSQALSGDIRGLRIGVPEQYFLENIDPEIRSAMEEAIQQFGKLGAEIVGVSVPHLENCAAMEAHITLAEATSYHERWLRERPEDYGAEPRTKLEAGRYLLATDYVKSQRARTLLQQAFDEVFGQVDVIVSPTLPAFPPPIGEVWVQSGPLREHVIDAFLRFVIPFNLTGLPALSLPCGRGSGGLPVGLQIASKAWGEPTIFRAAHAYEAMAHWGEGLPPIVG